jgi:hypothetical protein
MGRQTPKLDWTGITKWHVYRDFGVWCARSQGTGEWRCCDSWVEALVHVRDEQIKELVKIDLKRAFGVALALFAHLESAGPVQLVEKANAVQ